MEGHFAGPCKNFDEIRGQWRDPGRVGQSFKARARTQLFKLVLEAGLEPARFLLSNCCRQRHKP